MLAWLFRIALLVSVASIGAAGYFFYAEQIQTKTRSLEIDQTEWTELEAKPGERKTLEVIVTNTGNKDRRIVGMNFC